MGSDVGAGERRRPSPGPRTAPEAEPAAAGTAAQAPASPADTPDVPDGAAVGRAARWRRGRRVTAEPAGTPRHAAPAAFAAPAAAPAQQNGRSPAAAGNGAAPPRPSPRPRPDRAEGQPDGHQAVDGHAAVQQGAERPSGRDPRPPDLTKFLDASQPQPEEDGDAGGKRERRLRRKGGDDTAGRTGNGTADTAAADSSADAASSAEPKRKRKADKPEAEKPKAEKSTAAKTGDGEAEKGSNDRRAVVRRLVRLFLVLAIIAGAAITLRVYVVQPYYIPSASMEPTLHGCPGCDDDHILINKLSDTSGTPGELDVVVFRRPAGVAANDSVLVKRVIGLPGDTVALKKGLVYVNGLQLTEPYVNKKCGAAATKPLVAGRSSWQVPDHDVFVMGDNRCDSEDSRAFGPIPTSSIIGKVFAITWPFGRIGGVN